MAGTSARWKPAHRRFIGNGPGTEIAARSAAGRVRGCHPLWHQVARRPCRWVRRLSARGADYVL